MARPRLVGINDVALEVGDIDEALAFYGRVFDLELRGRSREMAFIDIGDHLSPGSDVFSAHDERDARTPVRLETFTECLRPTVAGRGRAMIRGELAAAFRCRSAYRRREYQRAELRRVVRFASLGRAGAVQHRR